MFAIAFWYSFASVLIALSCMYMFRFYMGSNIKYLCFPGGSPGNSWRWSVALFSKSWPYFRPKNVIFHDRFETSLASKIHTRFQTWLTDLHHHYLYKMAKEKFLKINCKFAYLILFLSFSFRIGTKNTFVHTRGSLKNHFRAFFLCLIFISRFRYSKIL